MNAFDERRLKKLRVADQQDAARPRVLSSSPAWLATPAPKRTLMVWLF